MNKMCDIINYIFLIRFLMIMIKHEINKKIDNNNESFFVLFL